MLLLQSKTVAFHGNRLECELVLQGLLGLATTLRKAFVADQLHCVPPVDDGLSEVVQEGYLVLQRFGHLGAEIAVSHPFEEVFPLYLTVLFGLRVPQPELLPRLCAKSGVLCRAAILIIERVIVVIIIATLLLRVTLVRAVVTKQTLAVVLRLQRNPLCRLQVDQVHASASLVNQKDRIVLDVEA